MRIGPQNKVLPKLLFTLNNEKNNFTLSISGPLEGILGNFCACRLARPWADLKGLESSYLERVSFHRRLKNVTEVGVISCGMQWKEGKQKT